MTIIAKYTCNDTKLSLFYDTRQVLTKTLIVQWCQCYAH